VAALKPNKLVALCIRRDVESSYL